MCAAVLPLTILEEESVSNDVQSDEESLANMSTKRTSLATPLRPRRSSLAATMKKVEEFRMEFDVDPFYDSPTSKRLSISSNGRRKSISVKERVKLKIREMSEQQNMWNKANIDKTLETIKAGATAYFKNGKEMWSRESQTVELINMDLIKADRVSKSVKKDIETVRSVIKHNCNAKVQQGEVILVGLLSQKLKAIEAQYTAKISALKKDMTERLRREVQETRENLEIKAANSIKELKEQHAKALNDRQIVFEKVRAIFQEKNEEYQCLRYQSARMYMVLKRKNVPELVDSNSQTDAEKAEFVESVSRLREAVKLCDEEIRVLHPKMFKLEEEVDFATRGRQGRTTIFGENNGTLLEEPPFIANNETREYVRQKLTEQFEEYLKQSRSELEDEYQNVQEFKERTINEWNTKFRSADAIYDSRHLNSVLKRQSRILQFVSNLVSKRMKSYRQEISSACHLHGDTLQDLLNMEFKCFKASLDPVLKQLLEITSAKKKAKKFEEKKKAELLKERIAAESAQQQALESQGHHKSRISLYAPESSNSRAYSVLTPVANLLIPSSLSDKNASMRSRSRLGSSASSTRQSTISHRSDHVDSNNGISSVAPSMGRSRRGSFLPLDGSPKLEMEITYDVPNLIVDTTANIIPPKNDIYRHQSRRNSSAQWIQTILPTIQADSPVEYVDGEAIVLEVPSTPLVSNNNTDDLLSDAQISIPVSRRRSSFARYNTHSRSSSVAKYNQPRSASINSGFNQSRADSTYSEIPFVEGDGISFGMASSSIQLGTQFHSRAASVTMPEEYIHMGWQSRGASSMEYPPSVLSRRGSYQEYYSAENPQLYPPRVGLGPIDSKIEEFGDTEELLEPQMPMYAAFNPNTQEGEFTNFDADMALEYHRYLLDLSSMKKSVVKGLAGVDVRKPQHLPPLSLEIQGIFITPDQTKVQNTKAKSATPCQQTTALQQKLMRIRLRDIESDESEKASEIKFNLRPWSTGSSVRPQGCQDMSSIQGLQGMSLTGAPQKLVMDSKPPSAARAIKSAQIPRWAGPTTARKPAPKADPPPCVSGIKINSKKPFI
ncbi:hypothetical protein BDR26DRAFT_554764 [Obelidium mucronatum]|nr:hypothetical protein BDR26DRAFT_554764 [Obelidium mucronatum]